MAQAIGVAKGWWGAKEQTAQASAQMAFALLSNTWMSCKHLRPRLGRQLMATIPVYLANCAGSKESLG